MKVLFDARTIGPKMHGIGRYAYHLLLGLMEKDEDLELIILAGDPSRLPFAGQQGKHRVILSRIPPYSLKEQVYLPLLVRSLNPDLVHIPSYNGVRLIKVPLLMTIHDVIHLVFPGDYSLMHRLYWRWVVKPAAHAAHAVFTDSDHSREDLVRHLALRPSKVRVVPLGVDDFIPPLAEKIREGILKEHRIPRPFIFSLGNPKPHKNMNFLMAVWDRLTHRGISGNLVVVGIRAEQVSPPPPCVLFLEHAGDMLLRALYQEAQAFIFPSRYEGFGLPVLEAMASGTPVVTARVSSIPEILREGEGMLLDSFALGAWEEALVELLGNETLQKRFIEAGLARAREFTWEKTVRDVLMTYREILKGTPG